MRQVAFLIILIAAVPVRGQSVETENLIQRYQDLLLLTTDDYQMVDVTITVFQDHLLPQFSRAVRDAKSYSYDYRGVPAYYEKREPVGTEEEKALEEANSRFLKLFRNTLPMLAYAYQTPGPSPGANPHYQNDEVLALYLDGLDYCYSRGLTEDAWIIDNAGRASGRAMEQGLVRTSGDFSMEILRLGGFIQSIFLMREPLAENGLLGKYRAVARNLVVNNGAMYTVFYQIARSEAVGSHTTPLPVEEKHYLNADGIRLFADYFFPYFLLIEDAEERDQMTLILREVIGANIAIKPGVQGTIKPDGTGYHHATAYVGAYSPFAFESMAQLLYLLRGAGFYRSENVEALKLALQSYRVMVQRYTVSTALRGRLIKGSGEGPSVAVAKAMAFLAHPDGVADADMRSRFAEFFDGPYFYDDMRLASLYQGQRSVSIRGLGSFRLIADLQNLHTRAAETPAGVWIKPYAAGAFFRRDDWLVTAKGFSQYFWDYEGPLDTGENSFGQNWAYGLLQVFSAGQPISEKGSGYDYFNGWDWYHVPGTTASHYPIEKRTPEAVQQDRQEQGIVQRSMHRNYNNKTFVGGVSIGDHGLFAQDLEAVPFTAPTDLQARKSYFFVGNKVLALGTHIRGGTDEDETHTTLFQTRLASAETPTGANGGQVDAGETLIWLPADLPVEMSDSVGNSYFLASSTSDLLLSRQLQQSLSPDYEPTEGAFVQAYLNHGIKPLGDSYQYVMIPADPDGLKLQALAANPSNYYQVIEDGNIHLVYFPEQQITGYAFFELTETPNDHLVRHVNLPAVVMTQENSDGVTVAASVPDIGWQFDREIVSHGLSYANNHFRHQKAKVHILELSLRGKWRLAEDVEGVWLDSTNHGTTLWLECTDGLSYKVRLTPSDGSESPNPTSRRPFSIPDRGGASFVSQGAAPALRVGYGQVETVDERTPPTGLAIFSLRQNGILISEASVPATAAVLEGRIFAEIDGSVTTGLAMANPNDSAAMIEFFFTDSSGIDSGHDSFTLKPGEQTAKFLDQDPFNGGSAVLGTFTFISNLPVAVIALRGFVNERSEFLMTTLPVAPLTAPTADTVYFPHFATGAGWTTQVILVNPTHEPIHGSVQFFGSGNAAGPVTLTLADGRSGSAFSYSIPPRSAARLQTSNPAGSIQTGSIRVVADAVSSTPSGVSVFSFEGSGVTVSEAGVPASAPGAAFRVYVETSGTPGQPHAVSSGIALANTSEMATEVSLELTALDGTAMGPTELLTIPASGQVARFIDQFFPALTPPFSGILRIASTATDIAVVGLRVTINQRNDIVITTTPPSDENATLTSSNLFFPHFADSGGWTTQFILFSGSPGQTASGWIRFTGQDGQPLVLSVAPTAPTIP